MAIVKMENNFPKYRYRLNLSQYNYIAKCITSNITLPPDKLCVFEIGSKDAADAFLLSCLLPGNPTIVSFDPHAQFSDLSKPFTTAYPNLKIENIALSNKNGLVDFYFTESSDTKIRCEDRGIGASSIKEPIVNLPRLPTVGFNKLQVQSITGQEFCRQHGSHPHVLILDTQGAETEVLNSFGTELEKVHLIFTEFNTKSGVSYKDDSSALDLLKYLRTKHFLLIKCYGITRYSGDGVFINTKLLL